MLQDLKIIAILCILLTSHAGVIGAEVARPNIVLILADDLGYAELGCYGQQKIQTPHLDQLASEGLRFTQFYTGAPVCAPARCTLMTGMHAGHAYVRSNSEVGSWESFRGQVPLPESTVTLSSLLKQAGYATGAFGKWGLGEVGSTGDPLRQGFDRFFGYNCQRHAHNLYPRYLIDDDQHRQLAGNTRSATGEQYAPQVIADEMLEFVRKHQDQPFFLYYPMVLPHLALQAPEEDIARYRVHQWAETPYEGDRYQHHPTPRACYAAMISFADKQVGRLMALLEELDLDENTIVLFTSDNGTTMLKDEVDYEFFESVGPLRGLKGDVLEGGIRVPTIARWPGRIAKNSVTDHVAANYDILATLTDLVGIESVPKTDSVSFLPTLLGKGNQQQHEYLFWDFTGYGGQLAVRMGDWKAVRLNVIKNPDAPLELYHLKNDIGESNDVAAQHPELVEKLQQIMIDGRTEPEVEQFRFGQYRP